ncbi:MAG TPA: bacillithiol biosynthesis cysteine-adding enzyme BshC, partial [Parafilimonas sp.]|nr:bacillithiol biosynthesis cysteine-adding enzyme BshC [Parafilimonas sp.]
ESAPQLQPFYNYKPDIEGVKSAIAGRKSFQHREILVSELRKQYQDLEVSDATSKNIQSLLDENTFTVTTAHQPNIFTGPLYAVYKIFHAIKLAQELNDAIPGTRFVPIYFIGSEDADLAELNHISINARVYTWDTKQTGSVGRMKVDDELLRVISEMEGQLHIQSHGEEITQLFRRCYEKGSSIQQASLKLANALFGEYGLIALIPDNAGLKRLFQPVIATELHDQFSHKAISSTIKALDEHYKVQASGREINLFYLIDDKRERIEAVDGRFEVKSRGLQWNAAEILRELDEHPERFSPNVILRGVFQEAILPNVAFIGGGGELAYWLEFKEVFRAAEVPYPVLLLRNSFLLIEKAWLKKIEALHLDPEFLFENEHNVMKRVLAANSKNKFALNGELSKFENLYTQIQNLTTNIDPTLNDHVAALKTRALKKLVELEKKMLRAEKKKFATQQQQVQKIKATLFPNNSLQERVENFSGFYARYGRDWLNTILQHSTAFQQQFGIITVDQ